MDELPLYMYQLEKEPDQHFRDDEHLFRRVPHELWEDDHVNVDAIDLPDMSVQREKYGPAQSARLTSEDHHDWGVIGFRVGDIPPVGAIQEQVPRFLVDSLRSTRVCQGG